MKHRVAFSLLIGLIALEASTPTASPVRAEALGPDAYLGIAFVSSMAGGLHSVGVYANGLEPLGSAEPQLDAHDTFVGTNAAYVAAGRDGLVVFDVGDPARPRRIASAPTQGTAVAVDGVGNMVYVAWKSCPSSPGADQGCRGGIDGFLVTNPHLPRLVSRFDALPAPTDLAISTPYIYVAWSDCGFGCLGGLEVVDYSDATQPRRVSGVSSTSYWPAFRMRLTESDHIETGFSRSITIAAGGDVRLIDATDPLRPVDHGLLAETPGEARDVDYFGYSVAAADGEAGVFIEQRFGFPMSVDLHRQASRIIRDTNSVEVVPTSEQAVVVAADGSGALVLTAFSDDAAQLDDVAVAGRPVAVEVVAPADVPTTGPPPAATPTRVAPTAAPPPTPTPTRVAPTSAPPPTTPTARPPSGSQTVVLIPGLAGSQLDNEPIEGCSGRPSGPVWLPGGILEILGLALQARVPNVQIRPLIEPAAQRLSVLQLDNRGVLPVNDCDRVRATGLLEQIKVVDGVTYVFRREWVDLTQRLTAAGHTVVACPYDWRLSPKREALFRLRGCIEQAADRARSGKVALVGHSMGGLVGAWYIGDRERAAAVSQLITVGSPMMGAPVMTQRLLTGQTGIGPFDQLTAMPATQGLLDRSLIQRIYRNAPGMMSVLPSEGYERAVGPAVYDAARDPFSGPQPRVGPDFDAFLAARNGNADLISEGRAFLAEIAVSLRTPNVPWTALLTSHRSDTVEAISIGVAGPTRREVMDLRLTEGDGTVPVMSALQAEIMNTDQLDLDPLNGMRCDYGVGDLAPERQHDTLVGDPKVGEDITRILDGRRPTHCAPVNLLLVPFGANSGARLASEVRTAYEVTIVGAVRAAALDPTSGNAIGWLPDGTWHSDLDAIRLIAAPDQTTFTWTEARPVTISAMPWSAHPWQIRVIRHSANFGAASTAEERQLYVDPPCPAGCRLNLEMVDPADFDSVRLTTVDARGVARSIAPSSRVTGDAARDVTPPVTRVELAGNRDGSGAYIGNVTVRLVATDAGAGVLGTAYSLDGGRSWLGYAGPFSVAAAVHPRLAAYSVDRAGNSGPPVDIVLRPSAAIFLPLASRGVALGHTETPLCSSTASTANNTLAEALAQPSACSGTVIATTMVDGDATDHVVVAPSTEGALSFTLWTDTARGDVAIALLDEHGQALSAAVERRDTAVHVVRWITPGRYALRIARGDAGGALAYRFRWSVATP